MCGRVALYTSPDRLARLFDAGLGDDLGPDFALHWDVPPTLDLVGLTHAAKTTRRIALPSSTAIGGVWFSAGSPQWLGRGSSTPAPRR